MLYDRAKRFKKRQLMTGKQRCELAKRRQDKKVRLMLWSDMNKPIRKGNNNG